MQAMNAPRPAGIPLRPDPAALRNANAKALTRAAFAHARRALNPYSSPPVEDIARNLWAGDHLVPAVLRAVSNPATTTATGWPDQLASPAAVGDFVSSLAPLSAAARVFDAAPRVSLDGIASISLPHRSGAIASSAVPWIADLAILTALTRECAEHGSGETVLATMLRENAALALDASLFSTTASSTVRPAGILNGVSALTATTG